MQRVGARCASAILQFCICTETNASQFLIFAADQSTCHVGDEDVGENKFLGSDLEDVNVVNISMTCI